MRIRLTRRSSTAFLGGDNFSSDYAPIKTSGKQNLFCLVDVSHQFRLAQEVIVASRVQFQISHTVRVYEHVVEVPQINVGQVLRENTLYLVVQNLPGLGIDLLARLIDQLVDLRIGVVVAVCAIGRELG